MQTKMYDRDLIRRKLGYDRDIIRCKLRYNRDKNYDEINQRLESLREVMRREHLSAFIFPSTDAHQSEYVADHWEVRTRISGFNGSAGTAVVTMKSAALWTDSRYFLARRGAVEGYGIPVDEAKIENYAAFSKMACSGIAGRKCR